MKVIIQNRKLTECLQKIHRLLIKNITFPILENILFKVQDGTLSLTVNNLEIELIVKIKIHTTYTPGQTTLSGRKLFNICRYIPKNSDIKMQLKNNKMHIHADNSRYILSTLPSENFPTNQNITLVSEFYISSDIFKKMIDDIEFSIGKNDVRHYLNGLLLKKTDQLLSSVATDGYRLAVSNIVIKENVDSFSVIIPRKSILELSRLLNIPSQSIRVLIGTCNIQVYIKDCIFTSQLMEGRYPDYKSVLLKTVNKPIIVDTILLKESLSRVAILSHEKFCGVEININHGQFKIISDNQEEETAEDIFSIDESNSTAEISINVYYILEVLNVIKSPKIFLFINASQSSIQITEENNSSTTYVIMLLKR